MLIWKIAWRNVWRHKGKSMVVGIILFLGMVVMMLGNAVTEGAKQGFKKNAVDGFTADLQIVSSEQLIKDLFFAPRTINLLRNYKEIKPVLAQQQDMVRKFLPLLKGVVMVMNEEGISTDTFAFGTDVEAYQEFFDESLIALEGELLSKQDRGVLMSDETRKFLFTRQHVWFVPEGESVNEANLTPDAKKLYAEGKLRIRHDIIILGRSEGSLETDNRLPLKGIYRFKQLNKMWGMFNYLFLDIESFRQSFGHLTAGDMAADLTEEQRAMLEIGNAEDMLADTDVFEEVVTLDEGFELDDLKMKTKRTDIQAPNVETLDEGVFSIVLVKLQFGVNFREAREQLTEILNEAGFGTTILTWEDTMGEPLQVSIVIQGALFMFVMFVFFVAIIIIMNTLSMAALERTREIGMMRAVGAGKSFISKMFLAETCQLSLAFGGTGILFGALLVVTLRILNIPTGSNEFAGLLLGGDTFNPVLQASSIVLGIVQLIIVTLLAVIYPMKVARKITPLEAIARD